MGTLYHLGVKMSRGAEGCDQAKRLPYAKGAISRPADWGIVLLNILVQACQPGGDASRWGFLLLGQKEPKPA